MSTAAPERTFVSPTFGSLLRAELLRVRSRRFVAWSALVLLLIMLLVAVTYFNTTDPHSQAEIDRALAACTADGAGGAGDMSGEPGGGPCDVSDAASARYFEGHPPAYRAEVAEWAAAIGLAAAAFGFILGATFGGADWAQRTMPALLFWEPRRGRVFAAKLLALALGVTVFFVAAQLVWLLLSAPTYAAHGVADDGSGPLTGSLAGALGRTLLLSVLFSTMAYGIASLTRNTGAALGAGFVYFAVVETFVALVFSRAQEYLVLINVGALMTPGGLDDPFEISSQQGALVLVAYAVVINGIAYALFRRRDIA